MKRLTSQILSIPRLINRSNAAKSAYYLRSFGLRTFLSKAARTTKRTFSRSAGSWPVIETDMTPYLGHEPLALDQPLSGSFSFPLNGLTSIEILTAAKRSGSSHLRLSLFDIREERPLVEVDLAGREVKDNDYSAFTFDQISDSAGRDFRFVLEGAGDPAPAVWHNSKRELLGLKLDRGGSINCRIFGAAGADDRYRLWMAENEPAEPELKKQRMKKFAYAPKISLLVPVFNTPEKVLEEMIQSVEEQTYGNWELCLADGASTRPRTKETLERHAHREARIKVKWLTENQGIAGNSNEALKLATGDYVALLDHDDTIAPFALYEAVRTINEDREVEFIYSDCDFLSAEGDRRMDPFFKPGFSPYFLLNCNYLAHWCVFKRALIDRLGGFRPGFDGAQDYDLVLRATEATEKIAHIPKVLYHWRKSPLSAAGSPVAKPYAFDAGAKAIAEALVRRGMDGKVTQDREITGLYQVKLGLKEKPLVSIIVPALAEAGPLSTDLASVLKQTTYEDYEIIIAGEENSAEKMLAMPKKLTSDKEVKLVSCKEPISLARAINAGVRSSGARFLVFLSPLARLGTSGWLEEMLAWCGPPDVGAAGGLLLYRDNTVRQAGYLLGVDEIVQVGRAFNGLPKDNIAGGGMIRSVKEYLAVSAAAMMVKKEAFELVGGFDEAYRTACAEIDFCLRLRQYGYRVLSLPAVEVYLDESKTKIFEETVENRAELAGDGARLLSRWKDFLVNGDPCYNPHLDQTRWDYSIKI